MSSPAEPLDRQPVVVDEVGRHLRPDAGRGAGRGQLVVADHRADLGGGDLEPRGGLVPVQPLVDQGGQVGLGERHAPMLASGSTTPHRAVTPDGSPGASEMPISADSSVRWSIRILPRPGAGGRRDVGPACPSGRRPAGERPCPAARRDHLTGRVLDGRYLIGSRIARGGMATVYEATDLRLDRTVAVKVMHPGLGDDEEFAARFVARGPRGGEAVAPQRRRGLRPGQRRRHGLPGHGADPRPHAARHHRQGGADSPPPAPSRCWSRSSPRWRPRTAPA